jgi:hypothetical protein
LLALSFVAFTLAPLVLVPAVGRCPSSRVRPRLALQATATRFAGCFSRLVSNFVACLAQSRSQATLVTPSNTATQCLGNPVTSTPARAFAGRSRHLLARRVAVASFQSPGARATPPPAPTDARASSRFGAFTSKAAVGVFSFSCSPLECGGSPLHFACASWVSRWTRSPHPTGGSPPEAATDELERSQSVSVASESPKGAKTAAGRGGEKPIEKENTRSKITLKRAYRLPNHRSQSESPLGLI